MSIRNLDEDYEAIYKDGSRPDPDDHGYIPVGRCDRMCSLAEMEEREKNHRLNRYEIIRGTNPPQVHFDLAVKEFKRSGLGLDSTCSENLRPWGVLKKTLVHLLQICLIDDDWMYISDFVFDRLKAVRQDMVIQRIEGRRCIEILERSIRFLIYSMYRLTCTLKDYTQIEPMKRVVPLEGPVKGLNNYEMCVVREMKLTMQCMRNCINTLIVQYQENVPDSPNRSLFEAVNLIVNLPTLHGNSSTSTEFQSKKELRDNDPMFKLVFKMYREHLTGNHWSALKHLPRLFDHPLLVLAYAPVIAQLQIHLVQFLRKLYSAGGSNTATLNHLCALICPYWLEVDEDERARFAKFIAVQFGFYDEKRNLCDFKNSKTPPIIPRDFVEKAWLERKSQRDSTSGRSDADNETRIYVLQMIAGREWSFYQDVIKIHTVESILDLNH